ncbi:MAG: M4 family metallopeptidase [Caldilineaceae bacterium]
MATLPLRFGALLTAIVGLILLPAHAWAVAATSSPVVASVPANPQQQRTIDELQTTSQGELVVQTHPTIGTIRLIQVAPGGDLLATWQSPSVHIDQLRRQQPNDLDLLHAKVEAFFATHGALTGLTNAVTTMRETESRRDAYGYTHIAYLQQYHDVPIFGGMVRTHFDNQGRLIAINGGALPADVMPLQKLNPLPTLTRENAVAQAIAAQQSAMAAAQTSEQATLTAATVTLYIYQIGLVQGVPGPIHLAYRVEVVNLSRTVREYIFVDAHTGAILDQFSAIYTLEREVSEGNLPNVVWDEGAGHPEPIPSGWAGSNSAQRQAWNDEITGAKETYNLFGSLTNGSWLSYSGQNAIMRTVNNDPTIQCPNANWDGVSANYCNGTTADDVVAHEWAHAYTEQTSGLIYAWQPGALNESFSDVWGETVDLLNGAAPSIHNGQRTANGCSTFSGLGGDNSTRWLAGEECLWLSQCAARHVDPHLS